MEIRIAEDFQNGHRSLDAETAFCTQTTAFTKSFLKKRKKLLLVVMSAVDWWKNAESNNLLGFLRSGVRWIFLRLFGKVFIFPTESVAGQIHQQSIRIIPTRSPQILHMHFGLQISPKVASNNETPVQVIHKLSTAAEKESKGT